jgi:hypothetical protein
MTANTTSHKKNPFDRIIDSIEWIGRLFVGIVAANIFIAVVLRKFFDTSIPDSYDFGRLLLGILIFWGIAADQLSWQPHHCRFVMEQFQPTHASLDRYFCNAGTAIGGDGADHHVV